MKVEVTPGTALSAYRSKQQRHTWGTTNWAQSTTKTHDAISKALADELSIEGGCSTYLACIQAFRGAFAKDTPMKLSRFETMQDQVFGALLPELVKQALAAAAPTVERMKQRVFDDKYCDDTKEAFVKLINGVQGCLTVHLYRRISKPLELPSHFVLEEAAEVHARRAELHHQLTRLQIAQQKISKIHEAVCTETTLQKDLLCSSASLQTTSDNLKS